MDDVTASSLGPESQLSMPLSRPGIPESGNEESDIASQNLKPPHWDDSNDSDDSYNSTSASPSSEERGTDGNGGNCDKMVEKWRLIRLADKNTPPKKVDDVKAAFVTRS